MKRTNIHLSDQQLKRLREEQKKTGAPMAELVRRAVDKVYPPKRKQS